MEAILDFIRSALPWVSIGLMAGMFAAQQNLKKQGKKPVGLMRVLTWTPMVCFLFVALLEYAEGKASSGTTWLVLGICNAFLAAGEKKVEA